MVAPSITVAQAITEPERVLGAKGTLEDDAVEVVEHRPRSFRGISEAHIRQLVKKGLGTGEQTREAEKPLADPPIEGGPGGPPQ
eukprot:1844157-Alexandrium_andersonii.AAC.1